MLVVTKFDRLARSVARLGLTVESLEKRKVGLRVLDLGLDTSTAKPAHVQRPGLGRAF